MSSFVRVVSRECDRGGMELQVDVKKMKERKRNMRMDGTNGNARGERGKKIELLCALPFYVFSYSSLISSLIPLSGTHTSNFYQGTLMGESKIKSHPSASFLFSMCQPQGTEGFTRSIECLVPMMGYSTSSSPQALENHETFFFCLFRAN